MFGAVTRSVWPPLGSAPDHAPVPSTFPSTEIASRGPAFTTTRPSCTIFVRTRSTTTSGPPVVEISFVASRNPALRARSFRVPRSITNGSTGLVPTTSSSTDTSAAGSDTVTRSLVVSCSITLTSSFASARSLSLTNPVVSAT